ncbi:hypothetical protein [Geminocystis sp. NIES-3708]|uniref:hypothetical protein n=1 Tax=Geminocystis sp. NIES-3708 TaxID=1615909 RepID=UPI00118760E7|nr:hypothetical protein [Geminocystis sp. NIES-3708]
MLYGEDFGYHDNNQFTFFTLQNRFFDMPIWPNAGRFWPLGLQEYNLISLISKTPIAYQSFSVLQLLIIIYLCLSILSNFNLLNKLFITTIIITSSTFVISFFGLIFPERNLIFWLAIFIFCLLKNQINNSFIYISGIFISAQFLLYYKEPSFLFIMGFCLAHLFLKTLQNKLLGKKINKISSYISENWIDFGLILLSLVFFFLYIFYIYGKVEISYTEERQEVNILSTFTSYIKVNPILLIFVLFLPLRIVGVCLGKYKINLIWDSLAIGNLLYFLAYLKLNMFRWYYTAPFDFVALLYLVNIISEVFIKTEKNKYKLPICISLLFLIFITNLHYSSYAILARKKEIESRVQTTNFLRNNIKNNMNTNLFFPANESYYIMEFASFLNYKNFPILSKNNEEDKNHFEQQANYLIMKASNNFTDNLCMSFRPFKCFESKQVNKNDFITFLPETVMLFSADFDQSIPINIINKYQQKSKIIFHYQPQFKGIESVLYFLTKNKINEKWLNVYIFTDFNDSQHNINSEIIPNK